MVVPGLRRHLAVDEPACRLKVEQRDLRLQQRRLHPLSLPRYLPFKERGENAERAVEAGPQVGDRDADAHRALSGQAGDRHEAAHALGDLVKAGTFRIWPILPEAGDAAIDEARIDLAQRLVVDLQLVLYVGPVVLDQHVGPRHELRQHLATGRLLEVERHAALVAMQVLEVGAVAAAESFFTRRLDFDDLGAPVGELPHAGRAGPHPRQVDDGKAFERLGTHPQLLTLSSSTRTICAGSISSQTGSCSLTTLAGGANTRSRSPPSTPKT